MTVTNSIVANSTSGFNCAGTATPPVTDGGYNISDDTSCGFVGTGLNTDTIGDGVLDTNLALDPSGLANNGGPTYTIALDSVSYAIAAIPLIDCPATDQRSFGLARGGILRLRRRRLRVRGLARSDPHYDADADADPGSNPYASSD